MKLAQRALDAEPFHAMAFGQRHDAMRHGDPSANLRQWWPSSTLLRPREVHEFG